jgi:hypothetical protein
VINSQRNNKTLSAPISRVEVKRLYLKERGIKHRELMASALNFSAKRGMTWKIYG